MTALSFCVLACFIIQIWLAYSIVQLSGEVFQLVAKSKTQEAFSNAQSSTMVHYRESLERAELNILELEASQSILRAEVTQLKALTATE